MSLDPSAPGSGPGLLQIRPGLSLPRHELTYRASRSGGPGGQHVNKTSTRIELTWGVTTSPALTDEQRARLLEWLGNRLDSTGTLRIVSDRTRSQLLNREDATERLVELIRAALAPRKLRRATKVSKAVKARRLDAKKKHGAKKAERRRRDHD